MAVALVSFTQPAGTGAQAVTGVGFRGKAVYFFTTWQAGSGLKEDLELCEGLTDGTTQFCSAIRVDNNAPNNGGTAVSATTILRRSDAPALNTNPTILCSATFTEFTNDGFSLNWSVTDGGGATIWALVVGGSGVQAHLALVGAFATIAETGVGFQPDVILGLAAASWDYDGSGWEGGGYARRNSLGWSDGTNAVYARLLASTSFFDRRRSQLAGNFAAVTHVELVLGGQVAVVHNVTSLDPDGFTLGLAGGSGDVPTYAVLSLAGIEVAIGTTTIPLAAGDRTITTGFRPDLVLLQSVDLLGNSEATQARLGVGVWTEAAMVAVAVSQENSDAQTSSQHTDSALRLYQAASTAGSSTLRARISTVTPNDTGATLACPTVTGAATQVGYLAIGSPFVASGCDGGEVPTSAEPAAGEDLSGLRRSFDAWLELDLDPGTEGHAQDHPLNHPPAYHHGKKSPRVESWGEITQRLSDPIQGYQSSGCAVVSREADHLWRAREGQGEAFFNREGRICLASDERQRALGEPIVAMRGALVGYAPKAGLRRHWEFLDVLARDFREFGEEEPIPLRQFGDYFTNCPMDLRKAYGPLYWGRYTGGASTGPAPIPSGDTNLGAIFTGFAASDDRQWGFGPTGGPAAPVVAAAEEDGGTVNLGQTPYNQVAFCAWAVTGGVEGDPFPYAGSSGGEGGVVVAVTGNGKQYRVTITPPVGEPLPDLWRVAMGPIYFGPRWEQILEIPGTETEAVFTHQPTFGDADGAITPGATRVSHYQHWIYQARFKYADGWSALSYNGIGRSTCYNRPHRISFTIPAGGAPIEIEIYKKSVIGDFFLKFVVPITQVDAAGRVYVDDRLGAGGTVLEAPLTPPRGKLPAFDMGDYTVDAYGTWMFAAVMAAPGQAILKVYSGTRQLQAGEFGISAKCLAPGISWPFATKYRLFGGKEWFGLYVRGDIAAAHRDGTAPLTVDGCMIEDNGDGEGRTIRSYPRQVFHCFTNYAFNSDKPLGAWNAIPTFGDGVAKIANFVAAAEAIERKRIGEEYEGHLFITEPVTRRELARQVGLSGDFYEGPDEHYRLNFVHIDDSPDLTNAPHYEHVRSIFGPIDIDVRPTSDLLNVQVYSSAWDFIERRFAEAGVPLTDDESIDDQRVRALGQARDLKYIQNAIVAKDVVRRPMLRAKQPPRFVGWWTNFRGWMPDSAPGRIVLLTDVEGVGQNGFERQPIVVLMRKLVLGRGLVYLWGLDLGPITAGAGVLGPVDLPTFTAATAAQKAKYIFASDANGLMSDGTRALRVR